MPSAEPASETADEATSDWSAFLVERAADPTVPLRNLTTDGCWLSARESIRLPRRREAVVRGATLGAIGLTPTAVDR